MAMREPLDRAAVAPLVKAELARRNLLDFATLMDADYQRARHLELLAGKLESLERSDIRRLLLSMPPRHGKTELAKYFAAWFLGNNPRASIVLASYGSELAESSSRRVRELVEHERWPWPSIRVRVDSRAVNRWETTSGGTVIAAGVGSGLTGWGADLLIIDDAVRDREAAESAAIRESTWTWFTDVARTRLHPGGRIVVIGTRWHQDDLMGHILSGPTASEWTKLILPAICEDEEHDPLGRKRGEPLWPERFPVSELPKVEEIGSRAFSALYLCAPTSAKGHIFRKEWLQNRYDQIPSRQMQMPDQVLTFGASAARPVRKVAVGIDAASKTGAMNDFSVAAAVMWTERNYYILEIVRKRVQFIELVEMAKEAYNKWRPRLLTVEDTSNGTPLIQALKAWTGIPLQPMRPIGSKEARAESITPLFEAGRVFLPESAPWVDEFITELCEFPFGKHDDQLDAVQLAIGALRAWNIRDREVAAANAAFQNRLVR
jgi:predicted phage terminase large subunit-like protein